MKRWLLIFFAACLGFPVAARSASVVWGVNDDNARFVYPAMTSMLEPLRAADSNFQIAVSLDWRKPVDLGAIPSTQPLLVILGNGGLGASGAPLSDADQLAFAQVARSLVDAHPNVKEIQVWTETHDSNWRGTIQQYVSLLARTHDALDGRALVLGGPAHPEALLPPFPPSSRRINMASFARAVRDLYRHGGPVTWDDAPRTAPVVDGVAYHPYYRWNEACTKAIAAELDAAWVGVLQRPPLWWTETGMWSSGTPWGAPPMVGTPDEQAQRVADLAHVARASGLVAGDFNFLLADAPSDANGAGPAAWAWKSGLYYQDHTAKPALTALLGEVGT